MESAPYSSHSASKPLRSSPHFPTRFLIYIDIQKVPCEIHFSPCRTQSEKKWHEKEKQIMLVKYVLKEINKNTFILKIFDCYSLLKFSGKSSSPIPISANHQWGSNHSLYHEAKKHTRSHRSIYLGDQLRCNLGNCCSWFFCISRFCCVSLNAERGCFTV